MARLVLPKHSSGILHPVSLSPGVRGDDLPQFPPGSPSISQGFPSLEGVRAWSCCDAQGVFDVHGRVGGFIHSGTLSGSDIDCILESMPGEMGRYSIGFLLVGTVC